MRPYTMHQVIVLLLCALTAAGSAPRCDESFIKGTLGEYTYAQGAPIKELTCNSGKMISVDGTSYKKIQCGHKDKWVDENTKLLQPLKLDSQDIIIKCVDPPLACDKSLIRKYYQSKMTFANNKLECINKINEELEYIESGSNMKKTDSLECVVGASGVWKAGGTPVPSLKNYEPLVVSCVTQPCDQSLIKGFSGTEMVYSNKKLRCTKSYQKLQYPIQGSTTKGTSEELECDPSGFWKEGTTPTTVPASKPIAVSCVDVPCAEGWITKTNGATYSSTPYKLSCLTPQKLKIAGTQGYFDDLICFEAEGWKHGASVKIGNKVKFTVTCITECERSLSDTEASFNPTTHTLTCNNAGKLKVATIEYQELKCDGGEWKDGAGVALNPSVPADVKLTVTCTAPPATCHRTLQAVAITTVTVNADTTKTLACTTAGSARKAMEIKGVKYASLTCDGTNWKNGDNVVESATIPLDVVNCVEYCAVQHKCSTASSTCINELEDGLTVEATENTGVYECNIKDPNLPKYSITINDKYAFSISIKCDMEKGWTDAYGETLEQKPFEKVTIGCGAKCTAPGPMSCTRATTLMPKEYFCLQTDAPNERSPFAMTNDPNFISCETNPMKIIFDGKNNKFYDYKLRCKEDGTWYKFEDLSKTTIVDKSNKEEIICVRRRCNMCTILDGITDIEFTAGTASECAKSTCAKNLWKITKPSTPEEEYAGEVTCSSETEGQWLIDGDTPIVKGSCITTVSSCTVAAKLDTKCIDEWKSAGCQDFTPADDGQITCPTGKTMFYKHKGEEYFEEGAKNIECMKTEGEWKMTPAGILKRGATVVCSDSNPAPMPTTTTPVPEPACVVCPEFTKANDVKREDSPDKETCTVTPLQNEYVIRTKDGDIHELNCSRTEKKWRTKEGKEVDSHEVTVVQARKEEPEGQMMWIIGGVIGGVVVLFVVFIVIFKVCVFKKKPDDKDEETKRKMLEEGRKKKMKAGDNNDEILDDVAVENPSEIKL